MTLTGGSSRATSAQSAKACAASEADSVPSPFLAPLAVFYDAQQVPLPRVEVVEPDAMPALPRELLVHDQDMTSTLERHSGQSLHLRVLDRLVTDEVLSRLVLLCGDADQRVVEFGAIQISLRLFPPDVKPLVLASRVPLGRILNEQSVPYTSQPQVFFRVTADAMMASMLRVPAGAGLWGRQNVLWSPGGEWIARVVEILPLTDA